MVGDREAVRLVADALQQLQLGRRVVEHERRARGPGRNTSSMRLASEIDRHAALAEAAQRPEPGRELALAAVDHDEVRQRREARVVGGVVRRDVRLALPLREAPFEHLGHRGEVVGGALASCGS